MNRYFFVCIMACLLLQANAQPKPTVKTGENTITLTGERFHHETIALTACETGADNLWFDSGKQKFTDIYLAGKYDGRRISILFRVPGQKGTYTIENNRNEGGSQNNDNNCYLTLADKDGSDGTGGQPGSLVVTFTTYDKVGGLIEGTINGTLIGGQNDVPITVSGKFSIIRNNDRKGF